MTLMVAFNWSFVWDGCAALQLLRWAARMRSAFILLSLMLFLAEPACADVSAAQLYEDCTAAHIPASARKPSDWVNVRRCENVVAGVVRRLQWPLQVPSKTTWPGGSVTSDLLICPTDAQWYDDAKLVEFYLKYWDRKGIGFLTGRAQSAQSSTLEAFEEQFHDCAKAAKK